MQKVWFRKFDGWWYLTLAESGSQQQIKLVKGPNDRETKAKAEKQAVQELASRQHAIDSEEKTPSWATAGHVIQAFLRHSAAEHTKETAAWHSAFAGLLAGIDLPPQSTPRKPPLGTATCSPRTSGS